MTQSNKTPDASSTSHPAAGKDDPSTSTDALLHLHKMSITAGMGSGDYVALNPLAVVSVLFGLASLLALIGHILIIVPLVGIVLALVSLKQIRQSNGTQTGQLAAWSGLVLSVLIGGGIVGSQALWQWQTDKDRAQIRLLVQQLSDDLRDGKYPDAYNLFDAKFQDRVSKRDFVEHFAAIQSNREVGGIDRLQTSGISVQTDPVTERREADATLIPHYQKQGSTEDFYVRLRASFVDTQSSGWKIRNVEDFFPHDKKSVKEPAGAGGGTAPDAGAK